MEQVSAFLPYFFAATTALTLFVFMHAVRIQKGLTFLVLLLLLLAQAWLGLTHFYLVSTLPPRPFLLLVPSVLLIAFLFSSKNGKKYLSQADTAALTLLHVVRVPVEITLYYLFVGKAIPELMTFEGRNFDILSGISAPFVWYLGYYRRVLSRKVLIAWNLCSMGLLFNIVGNAITAMPTVFQLQAFDQPNIGVLYFPYVWLPALIVPLVFLAHLICLKELWVNKGKSEVKKEKVYA